MQPEIVAGKRKQKQWNDLKKAEEFHGHLGPYLALGLLMGELALKKLKSQKILWHQSHSLGCRQKAQVLSYRWITVIKRRYLW
jgi:hypothetical protein